MRLVGYNGSSAAIISSTVGVVTVVNVFGLACVVGGINGDISCAAFATPDIDIIDLDLTIGILVAVARVVTLPVLLVSVGSTGSSFAIVLHEGMLTCCGDHNIFLIADYIAACTVLNDLLTSDRTAVGL